VFLGGLSAFMAAAAWLRGGVVAAGAVMLLTGACFAILLPPEVHFLGSVLLALGVASVLYGLARR